MFASKEGQAVPQVTFPTRKGDAWVNVCLLYTSPSPRD